MTYLEPASYLQIIFMHIGGRFLKFKVTPVQEKMLINNNFIKKEKDYLSNIDMYKKTLNNLNKL